MQRHFWPHGVFVTIPDQKDEREYVIKGPLPYPNLVNKQDDFELIRLVINFGVEEARGGEGKANFDPAMELVVALTKEDLAHLESDQDPKLAYWDEDAGCWIPWTEPDIDDKKSRIKVAIETWGDPGVGVGR